MFNEPIQILNYIDELRRYETQLYDKIRNIPSRKEEILKLSKQYQREQKIINKIINDFQNLYELKIHINQLENKK
jgi:hypothetical protein